MKGSAHPQHHPATHRAKQLLQKEIRFDRTLFVERMRELDQEFSRQTKQLAALTKRLGGKLKK